VLVLDTHTTDESMIREQSVTYREGLAMAGGGRRSRLVLAVPEPMVCLFAAQSIIRDVFGVDMTPEERVEARYAPTKALLAISERSRGPGVLAALHGHLADDHVDRLRPTPLIQEILQAIADLTKQQAA